VKSRLLSGLCSQNETVKLGTWLNLGYNRAKGPAMRFVYVLEDDSKFQKEISEAIAIIDPKIQIRIFSKLESFAKWVRLMMATGPKAIAMGGDIYNYVPQVPVENEPHQLVLVVSKVEFLGVEQLELLRKTRKTFIDRKICTAEDPTAFVLTAFDDPAFKLKELENRILNNVIFKPFDRLILTQHLIFAIDGRHPPTINTITNQKTTAVVELLKDIQLEYFSDVGFVSISDREVPVGAISKYYGKSFLSDRQRSLFAVCQSCVPHPTTPGMFQCAFTFFSADQTQVSNLRRKIRAKEAKPVNFHWGAPSGKASELNVVLLDEEENSPSGLGGQLEKGFQGVKVTTYPSFGAFLSDLDPTQALKERDSNLKALGGATTATLSFDTSGMTYIGAESDKKDLAGLFGISLAELKSKGNWFAKSLANEHREKYRQYVQTGKLADENTLSITVNEIPFLVKATKIEKSPGRFQITLVEPSKEEQIIWLQKNTKLQKPVDLIIATHQLFGTGAAERWEFVKTSLKSRFGKEAKVLMTSKKDFGDKDERSLGNIVQDIFYKPVDRVYFLQKVKCFFPDLKEKGEKLEIRSILQNEIVKSVNPIKVTEMSEAGLIMQYYRPISIGSFREIVLWQPYEIGAPELLATCNYIEENPAQKGTYNCHFVFFGISDHFLKHIRIWIKDNYILSKDGQAS